jgi:hypothetical protein
MDLIADAREAAAVRLAGHILYELLESVVSQLLVFDEGIMCFSFGHRKN